MNPARLCLALGALIAATYLATEFVDIPFPQIAIWKAAGIILFGVYALLHGARLAAAGLFFSAAGDVALALPTPSFVAGMAFFGIAHLFYAAAFFAILRRDGRDQNGVPAAVVLAASLAMLFWFLPDMGALVAPGLGYQGIITAMVLLALTSRAPQTAKLGAVLFMISDTLIALGLYKDIVVVPGAVWTTYAAAQFLIARGFVTEVQSQKA